MDHYGSNFIICSLPASRGFQLIHQRDFGLSHHAPDQSAYVVVRPFLPNLEPLFIRAESQTVVDSAIPVALSEASKGIELGEADYRELVGYAKAKCASSTDKIVVSRSVDIRLDSSKWFKWLTAWKESFPGAFVYMLQTEKYGTWLGASPEILVMARSNRFETMALAGTAWGGEPFTQKEHDEHQVVTASIMHNLDGAAVESETREVNYGSIRHLRTDIQWISDHSVLETAERLHPTPAVCGHPKEAALALIIEREQRPRLLYTGYIGYVNERESSEVFVNLRCMQLFRDRIRVYVGGGVNRLSDPQKEWDETEKKVETILNAIQLNG